MWPVCVKRQVYRLEGEKKKVEGNETKCQCQNLGFGWDTNWAFLSVTLHEKLNSHLFLEDKRKIKTNNGEE